MAKFEFKSMTHKGPVFPSPYKPIGLTAMGDDLSALAEEMLNAYARYYCGMTDSVNKKPAQMKTLAEYINNKYFNKNFYNCLKWELTANQKKAVFPKDFEPVLKQLYAKQLADKAAETKESKAAKTDATNKQKEIYGFAIVDGKEIPRGSYVIESPNIIITRGDSQLIGSWKYQVEPEDVVINWVDPTGKEPEIQPPAGHKWRKVEHNLNSVNTFYYDVSVGRNAKGMPITTKEKWCRLGGEVNQNADQIKYDKAIQMVKEMSKVDIAVQQTLTKKMPNKPSAADIKERDCALVVYLVRNTGIRVGGEHDDFEAQTVGASTLLKENMQINGSNMILDFLGKDSVHYENTVAIDPSVAALLDKILYIKAAKDQIFSCSADDVNKYLQEILPYASIKLFRTSLATALACKELQAAKITDDMSVARKLQIFENVNLAVAKKLNHQKNISANFKDQADKLADKVKEAKAKKIEAEKKAKAQLITLQKEIDAAKKLYTGAQLKGKLAKLKEKKNKIQERIDKASERLDNAKIKQQQKTATANYALGTSKSAYFGPQVIYSWCHTFNVPVEKIYSKTLREKYSWAENVDNDYWKDYPTL